MKNTYKNKKVLAVTSLVVCIVISLISALYFQVRKAKSLKDSLYQIHSVEMTADIEKLLNNLSEKNAIQAYHYAKSGSDNAAKSGERKVAMELKNIAERIIEEGITEDLYNNVVSITNDKSYDATPNNASKKSTISNANALPSFVATERYASAKKNANYIFGGEDVVEHGTPNGAGKIIFSCANAYALIDEKTALPLEASLSYAKNDNSVLSSNADKVAEEFLIRFFSRNSAETAVLEEKSTDSEEGLVHFRYLLGKRRVCLSVEDGRRVVRYFITEI